MSGTIEFDPPAWAIGDAYAKLAWLMLGPKLQDLDNIAYENEAIDAICRPLLRQALRPLMKPNLPHSIDVYADAILVLTRHRIFMRDLKP